MSESSLVPSHLSTSLIKGACLRAGIALYTGKARLLSCRHHYHDYIPPLVDPGTPQEGDCVMEDVTYVGPFAEQRMVGDDDFSDKLCPRSPDLFAHCVQTKGSMKRNLTVALVPTETSRGGPRPTRRQKQRGDLHAVQPQ